jgi:hypothetical protein
VYLFVWGEWYKSRRNCNKLRRQRRFCNWISIDYPLKKHSVNQESNGPWPVGNMDTCTAPRSCFLIYRRRKTVPIHWVLMRIRFYYWGNIPVSSTESEFVVANHDVFIFILLIKVRWIKYTKLIDSAFP